MTHPLFSRLGTPIHAKSGNLYESRDWETLTYTERPKRVDQLLRRGILADYPEQESWAITHHHVPKDYV